MYKQVKERTLIVVKVWLNILLSVAMFFVHPIHSTCDEYNKSL